MTVHRRFGFMAALTLSLWQTPSANAESDNAIPTFEEQTVTVVAPPPRHHAPLHRQLSIWAGVPLFADVDRDIVRPGGAVQLRYGFDHGWFVPELLVGYQGTPVEWGLLDPAYERAPLSQMLFEVGMRFQYMNESLALPYLGAGIDTLWWFLRDAADVCGVLLCVGRDSPTVTFGFSFRGGVALEVRENVLLDLGLTAQVSLEGDLFDHARWWLTPFVGITLRR